MASPRRMSVRQLLNLRLLSRTDWFGLGLMALAAPWTAGCIHSVSVYRRGTRLYNAEVGGIFFGGGMTLYAPPTLGDVLFWLGGLVVPTAVTFVALLFVRKQAAYRWLVWICFAALWTLVCFKTEIAIS